MSVLVVEKRGDEYRVTFDDLRLHSRRTSWTTRVRAQRDYACNVCDLRIAAGSEYLYNANGVRLHLAHAVPSPISSVVVVVRDPDYSNESRVFGDEVFVHDIDLGRMDLSDPAEWREWAESHDTLADELEKRGRGDAAAYIREAVEGAKPNGA